MLENKIVYKLYSTLQDCPLTFGVISWFPEYNFGVTHTYTCTEEICIFFQFAVPNNSGIIIFTRTQEAKSLPLGKENRNSPSLNEFKR